LAPQRPHYFRHTPDESNEDQSQVPIASAPLVISAVSMIDLAEPDGIFPVNGELPVKNFINVTRKVQLISRMDCFIDDNGKAVWQPLLRQDQMMQLNGTTREDIPQADFVISGF
jgi:hypothetical protein